MVWLPFFIFPYIGLLIIPIDFHIFERGGLSTNQECYLPETISLSPSWQQMATMTSLVPFLPWFHLLQRWSKQGPNRVLFFLGMDHEIPLLLWYIVLFSLIVIVNSFILRWKNWRRSSGGPFFFGNKLLATKYHEFNGRSDWNPETCLDLGDFVLFGLQRQARF